MPSITDKLDIPDSEITFRYSRSSGPGGQNVNKVATKVTLLYDVASSGSLTDAQRTLIARGLSNRISKDGVLHVTAERHRTRHANQRAAVQRFVELLREALHETAPRHQTRIPQREKRRRRRDKRHRSKIKELRRTPIEDD
jgi:ribosome-associated protein